MPMPAETDTTSPKHLRDKYAIVGVGETTYTRGSGMTTRALGTWAVRNAIEDAGLKPSDVDGMLSYQSGDSTFATFIAGDLGIRLNFYMDVFGGGSSTEALVGMAMGLIEAGMCKTVVIFRAMNGYSQVRIGGTGARAVAPVSGDMLHSRAYGWQSAGQMFSPTFMRHMYDYGTRPEQVAAVKAIHSEHASNNPKALYKKRVTRRRRAREPHHLQAAAPARLLRRDRQRHGARRDERGAGARLPASARADPRRRRPLQQAAHGHALPARTDLDGRRPLCPRDPVAQCRGRAGGYRRHRLVRRLHLHHDAAARGLRLLQEGRRRRTM